MEINVEKANVRQGVMDCLVNIVDDFEYGIEHRKYAIFVPVTAFVGDEIKLGEHKEVVTKPEIVYRNIVANGRDPVADYLTEKIYVKMQLRAKQ